MRNGAAGPSGRAGWLALVLLACQSCGDRTLTEADCRAVSERLEEAWRADGNDAVTIAKTDQFRRFVVDEGKAIAKRWLASCRAQVGRPVDEAELRCLHKAKHIEDVLECQSAVR